MSAPDVSVIIAHFRSGDSVIGAITSALGQSGVSVEVIVVDDASEDGSYSKLRDFSASDARVQVFALSRNSGPSAARNRALKSATGEWIAVLDADDYFKPGRLENLICLARTKRADAIADNIVFVRDEDEVRTRSSEWLALDEPLRLQDLIRLNTPWDAPGVKLGYMKPLIRREFLHEHGILYHEAFRIAEDVLLYSELLLSGARFFIAPSIGYVARERGQSLSRGSPDVPVRVLEAHDAMELMLSGECLQAARRRRSALSLEAVQINARAGRYLVAARHLLGVAPSYAVERAVHLFSRRGRR